MPIQFRCVYCSQLLGIARRKSGAIIRCPSCDRQLVVPRGEGMDDSKSSSSVPMADPILEKSDFSAILHPPRPEPGEFVAIALPPPPVATESGKSDFGADLIDVEPSSIGPVPPIVPAIRRPEVKPLPAKPVASGLYLSPTKVTVATVVLLVVMALVFGAGLFVGRLLWSHS